MQWRRRDPLAEKGGRAIGRATAICGWLGVSAALANAARVLFWLIAVAVGYYAIWWAVRMMPSVRAPVVYRPRRAIQQEIAPSRPPTRRRGRDGARARRPPAQALGLLYRGSLRSRAPTASSCSPATPSSRRCSSRQARDPERSAYLADAGTNLARVRYRRAPARLEVESLAAGYRVMHT
jgi:hypothetical protein